MKKIFRLKPTAIMGIMAKRALNAMPSNSFTDSFRLHLHQAYGNIRKLGYRLRVHPKYCVYDFDNGISFKVERDYWTVKEFFFRIPHLLDGDLGRYGLKAGDVAVDCGAYLGVFTLYAAKMVGPNGMVIAFEPDPANFNRLTRNVRLNGLNNVVLLQKGVWSSETTLRFNARSKGTSNIYSGNTPEEGEMISIPVTTIDAEAGRLGLKKVDFIKMDIEGAEIEAVNGASATLKNNDLSLAIASNHVIGGKPSNDLSEGTQTCHALERLFPSLGYHSETGYPPHPTTYAWKKANR